MTRTTSASVKRYQRAVVSPAGFFLVLAVAVVAWNSFQADQDRYALAAGSDTALLEMDPSTTSAILASIDQYTPLLEESAVTMDAGAAEAAADGFLTPKVIDHPFVTESTKLEQHYVVQGGDTITGIADRFGLHVATIAQRNAIKPADIESLQPGSTLTIPAADTSDSMDWLVQLNEQKEADRQKALADAAQKKAAQLAAAKKTTKVTASSGFDRVAGMNFIVPIKYTAIARRLQRDHFGIDFDAPVGTPAKAAQDGKVIQVTGGWAGGFGNSILVDHGGGVTTRYAHLSKIGVSVGETVSQGQVIGWSGNTGFSTGPHLHFETRVNGKAVDPFH